MASFRGYAQLSVHGSTDTIAAMTLDWTQMEDDMVAAAVAAVRRTIGAHRDEHFHAAAFDELYGEQCGPFMFGNLALANADDEGEWSPPDWTHQIDGWFPAASRRHWEKELATEAGVPVAEWTDRWWEDPDFEGEDIPRWDAVYEKFVWTHAPVARRTRDTLVRDGVVDDTFLVLAFDDDFDKLPDACLRPGETVPWLNQPGY